MSFTMATTEADNSRYKEDPRSTNIAVVAPPVGVQNPTQPRKG